MSDKPRPLLVAHANVLGSVLTLRRPVLEFVFPGMQLLAAQLPRHAEEQKAAEDDRADDYEDDEECADFHTKLLPGGDAPKRARAAGGAAPARCPRQRFTNSDEDGSFSGRCVLYERHGPCKNPPSPE